MESQYLVCGFEVLTGYPIYEFNSFTHQTWYCLRVTETKLLKLIYKKNKIIKSIEVHESGCIVTEFDPIRHHLNIKKLSS
jgi:hypothetical protein